MRRGEKQVLTWWRNLAVYALPWTKYGAIRFRFYLRTLARQQAREDRFDEYVLDSLALVSACSTYVHGAWCMVHGAYMMKFGK
jgi:hypothetical protein